MKARIKETGEIVQVVSCMKDTNLVEYIENSPTAEHYIISLDDVELIPGEKIIDWEERRYEIAKDILAGYASNSSDRIMSANVLDQIEVSVRVADFLIDKLKKERSKS